MCSFAEPTKEKDTSVARWMDSLGCSRPQPRYNAQNFGIQPAAAGEFDERVCSASLREVRFCHSWQGGLLAAVQESCRVGATVLWDFSHVHPGGHARGA
jgi:hypothetical protein